MDKSRYEEIDGLDVLERFSKGESVYNDQGNQLYIDDCKVWMTRGDLSGVISLTIANVLEGNWYVKKPFDVRAEMLARPDEWVGAFRNKWNKWCKVGLKSESMYAVETKFKDPAPVRNNFVCVQTTISELDRCIPIEDVPEEEWK